MKYLFYVLVLANLAFFLWETAGRNTQDSQETSQDIVIPSGGERILLLKELPITNPNLATSDDANPALPGESEGGGQARAKSRKAGNNCYLIGPTPTQTDAEGFLELLSIHARDAAVVSRPGDVPDGWWILYPRALNAEVARQNRKMLAEKGARDTWIFENGPLQWGISLGLFDTLEKAEAAQKPFVEKNIMTELTPRMVRGNVFWVKVPWRRPALELDEIVQVLNSQDPGLHIPAPVACD